MNLVLSDHGHKMILQKRTPYRERLHYPLRHQAVGKLAKVRLESWIRRNRYNVQSIRWCHIGDEIIHHPSTQQPLRIQQLLRLQRRWRLKYRLLPQYRFQLEHQSGLQVICENYKWSNSRQAKHQALNLLNLLRRKDIAERIIGHLPMKDRLRFQKVCKEAREQVESWFSRKPIILSDWHDDFKEPFLRAEKVTILTGICDASKLKVKECNESNWRILTLKPGPSSMNKGHAYQQLLRWLLVLTYFPKLEQIYLVDWELWLTKCQQKKIMHNIPSELRVKIRKLPLSDTSISDLNWVLEKFPKLELINIVNGNNDSNGSSWSLEPLQAVSSMMAAIQDSVRAEVQILDSHTYRTYSIIKLELISIFNGKNNSNAFSWSLEPLQAVSSIMGAIQNSVCPEVLIPDLHCYRAFGIIDFLTNAFSRASQLR